MKETKSGEKGQQELRNRKKQEDVGDGLTEVDLGVGGTKGQLIIIIFTHQNYTNITYHSETDTRCSGRQPHSRSEKGQYKFLCEMSVQSSTRSDGSGHLVLETLGQTQRCGDDGDDVGCEEFNISNPTTRREAKYSCKTGGVRIEYYVVQTVTPGT